MADFIGAFPDAPATTAGQINVYEVSALNGSGLMLHIDLYNTVEGANHARFAPFSHDFSSVPVPGAALLAMIGLSVVGLLRRRLA